MKLRYLPMALAKRLVFWFVIIRGGPRLWRAIWVGIRYLKRQDAMMKKARVR
jgi:hypothetical protein